MDDPSGFTPSASPDEQQNRSNQAIPGYPPAQFPPSFPPQFSQPFQPRFPGNFNPYGMPPFQAYGGFHHGNPYEGSFNFSHGVVFGRGAASEGALSSSPVESMVFGRGVAGSPASPISPAPQTNDVNSQAWSDNSDEEKRGGRMNWTEEEDLKLVSAWLHNSIDSVKGNAQKGNDFWKKIVAEFNSHVSVDRQRTVSQCKTHYTKTNKLIVHFNGCWIRMKRAHGSGESDDQVMERAHAIYKREAKEKPFTFDYWWKVVKDQPKWAKRTENQEINMSKRVKHNESGTYTSSANQESEDAEPLDRPRPEGQKAKERLKGKEKKCTAEFSLETLKMEKMRMYHEATKTKVEAMQKAAESVEKQARSDMLNKYLDLMAVDTSGYTDARRQRHENALKYLETQLFI